MKIHLATEKSLDLRLLFINNHIQATLIFLSSDKFFVLNLH